MCCHPIRRSHFAKSISVVAKAARGVDFCFVILTLAVRPPIQRRAWLLVATGSPQPFPLSLLQSRIASELKVVRPLKQRRIPGSSRSCKLRFSENGGSPERLGCEHAGAESIRRSGAG